MWHSAHSFVQSATLIPNPGGPGDAARGTAGPGGYPCSPPAQPGPQQASQATPDQPASPQGVWSHPQDQPVVCRLVAGLVLVAEHVGGHVGQHGTPGG